MTQLKLRASSPKPEVLHGGLHSDCLLAFKEGKKIPVKVMITKEK